MAENAALHLGGLGPGNHEVWIKGTNNAGVASNVKRVVISIKPFWYQTGLFKTGVLLFAATLIYLLIRQRIQNIRSKSELKQKIAETEMRALRSQMNPHFIFNCLNSIGLYSAQNNSEMALYYLSKFSRLIRLTLDHSRSDLIALRQEIEMLELYLEMEKMRFKNKLNYYIIIDEGIEPDYVELPPMLIQPYVENAIWHGIMHRESGGRIKVHFSLDYENDILLVVVTDNGIGREKAAELRSKTGTQHKSFGMKITEGRMNLINELQKTSTSAEVVDLYTEDGFPAGTEVRIKIPV